MEETDKFDEAIFEYAKKYLSEKLSRRTIVLFCKKLAKLSDDRFGKIIVILEESFGRHWIEMMCCYRSTLNHDKNRALDILGNLVKDDQYLNIRKLQMLIKSACKSPCIKLSISTLRGEYGILIKRTNLADWGKLIFPVIIDSYSIKNISESQGFMAGWSTSKKLDPDHQPPGEEGELKKWLECVVYNSFNGYCYGYKTFDLLNSRHKMSKWCNKDNKMITSFTKDSIKFAIIQKNELSSDSLCRVTYNLSKTLYPTFFHGGGSGVYLLTELDFEILN